MKIIRRLFYKQHINSAGSILAVVLVFGAVAMTVVISGVASYALFEHKATRRTHARDMAFHIAEAGVNYYRWHLAQNPTDYQDGTDGPGPYTHDFTDKNGDVIGQFSLDIDAPPLGTSVVTIRSTGWTNEFPNSRRTVQVRLGYEALTDYVFLQNNNMEFGYDSEVFGAIHSNGGIHFNGTAHSWVDSAKERYKVDNQTHNGVWGGGGPKSLWRYPRPAVDFNGMSGDLASIRDLADTGGIHLSSSGDDGWHMVFQGDGFDLYRVNTTDCYDGERYKVKINRRAYWQRKEYCHDVGFETFVQHYDIPDNGAIFVEDNVWIDGQIAERVSLGVGSFPAQEPYYQVFLNGDISYAEQNSDDVFGVLAQGEIVIPYEVPDDMRVDAALLSQFRSIYRPYYLNDVKTRITMFGSQISFERGGVKHVNGYGNVVSGFEASVYVYDANLRYNPPPGFPVGETYELISWEEVE